MKASANAVDRITSAHASAFAGRKSSQSAKTASTTASRPTATAAKTCRIRSGRILGGTEGAVRSGIGG